MDNATEKFEWNAKTVKGDMTFLMEKTADANAKAKGELIAAATGGKVTVEEKRISQDDADSAVGSAKFAKKPLIEITGNKTVSFRI